MSEPPHVESSAVRAAFARSLLDAIEGEPEAAMILAKVSPAVLGSIERARATAWIDADIYQVLLNATHGTLGDPRTEAIIRRQIVSYRASPILTSVVDALITVLGATPHAALRHFPKLRDATVRNFGRITYEALGPSKARFVVTGAPLAFMNDANVAAWRGSLLGVADVGGAHGAQVALVAELRSLGDAEYELTWQVP